MAKKPTIGIIGIGSFTLDLAQRSADSGYKVFISSIQCSHTIKNAVDKIGKKAQIAAIQKTASSDIIVIFIPKEKLISTINEIPNLKNKIIIHHSYLITKGHSLTADINKGSSGKILTSLLPDSHIIKIFSSLETSQNSEEKRNSSNKVLYFTAQNKEAGERVRTFLLTLNFSVLSLIELFELIL